MDTRNKILTIEACFRPVTRPLVVATGTFDVLCAAHARELEEVRVRTGAGCLMAVVLPLSGEVLGQRARAEMVAALRMVDYVLIAAHEDVDRVINALKPEALVRLEAADARRARQLIEHVHRRQTC